MGGQVATTLAYVRTSGGDVVAVLPGDRVPDDAVSGEVERLTAAGVLEQKEPKAEGGDADGGRKGRPRSSKASQED